MRRAIVFGLGLLLSFAASAARAQDAGDAVDIAPGFKLSPTGQLVIGPITAEIAHFDTSWSVTEQHDAFEPSPAVGVAPTTQPTTHIINGTFTTAAGPFHLTEHVDVIKDGLAFSAEVKSDKEVPTNALYVGLTLPTDSFSGKQLNVDGEAVALPAAPAKPGNSGLFDRDDIQKIELSLPGGTLTITGDLNIHVQDDREWDNQQYSLRLQFSPASGQLKQSKIEFQMHWKPAGG
jgi:hypothetical protein